MACHAVRYFEFTGNVSKRYEQHIQRPAAKFCARLLRQHSCFSKDGGEHLHHLKRVFKILKHHQFVINTSKCVLGATRIEYLGYFTSADGVCTDPCKVKAIEEWPRPQNTKQVRSFLGLAGYYRCFVKGYGSIARALTDLLKIGGFKWDEETENSLKRLKEALITVQCWLSQI